MSEDKARIDLLGEDWFRELRNEFRSNYMAELNAILFNEYQKLTIRPNKENIFRSLKECPLRKTRVILLGQD